MAFEKGSSGLHTESNLKATVITAADDIQHSNTILIFCFIFQRK